MTLGTTNFGFACLAVILPAVFFISCANEGGSGGDREDVDRLISSADSLFGSGDYDRAREAYGRVAEMAEKSDLTSELTEAYSMIARCYLIVDRKEEGRPWIEKAGKTASPGEPLGWSRFLGVKGRFEWQDNENEAATGTFKAMYEYCSDHNLHDRAIDAAHMMAITGTPEEQVEWGLKGIKEAEAGRVTRWLGPLWNNLGWTYEHNGDYEKAIEAYGKARDYHYEYGNERNKVVADWALGHAHRLNGDIDQASEWMGPLLAKFEAMSDTEFIGLTHRELGEIDCARGDYDAALSHLEKAETHLRQAGMPNWDADGYEALVKRISEVRDRL
jgi:tetratricopeptide (TPR) repeat protein